MKDGYRADCASGLLRLMGIARPGLLLKRKGTIMEIIQWNVESCSVTR